MREKQASSKPVDVTDEFLQGVEMADPDEYIGVPGQ
jgi:hypothetical protein